LGFPGYKRSLYKRLGHVIFIEKKLFPRMVTAAEVERLKGFCVPEEAVGNHRAR
jgi:hypothetical protein